MPNTPLARRLAPQRYELGELAHRFTKGNEPAEIMRNLVA
jgi:hypothetical protein